MKAIRLKTHKKRRRRTTISNLTPLEPDLNILRPFQQIMP